ncbi:alpha/beta hydrolase [Chitinimonas arctica]|uniref:Alpha/beta hydrolase n=1 Tax=Chitinimonas arctica TaxID=2594795 RepID=A0A516SA43_9NEIS|nr:alpha/beta hydrolase [Chitinimonas arctica]QDQ25007.1 alpha/beta hydrolase [Chitinimonas arctica]
MPTQKAALHFSHANSFTAESYRQFLGHFQADYDVGYVNMLGHDPRYPVSDGWPNLVAESLAYIEQRYTEPVIAVGHSLGGFLSFMCALERPELFRAVVLLDSPIFGRPVSSMLWLGKRLGYIERLTPGRGTLNRRRDWADVEEAYRHFHERGMFRGFDPSCLRDYVEAGTEPSGAGVSLKFRPQVEYDIYCAIPHTFPAQRGRLRVPTGFIGGSDSNYVRSSDLKHMRQHFGIVLEQFAGGHHFPFEQPAKAAEAVKAMIGRLLNPSHPAAI